MKFVFTGGPYTQFMGRDFAFGKPVDIIDKATLEAIKLRADFKEYKPEEITQPGIKFASEQRQEKRQILTLKGRK